MASRGRRAAVKLNVTRVGLEERWLLKRRKMGKNVYRAKTNGKRKMVKKTFQIDKKCKENIGRRRILTRKVTFEKDETTALDVQKRRLFNDSVKTPETAPGGLLYNKECAPRCLTRRHENGCRHAKSYMARKKITYSLFLDSLLKTKSLGFRHKGRRGPFYRRLRTLHITEVTHHTTADGAAPRHPRPTHPEEPTQEDELFFRITANRIHNETVPSVSQYHSPVRKDLPKTRMRRQLTTGDAASNLDTDTDFQPLESGKVDFDNTTTMVIPPMNVTLEEKEGEEQNLDLNEGEQDKGEETAASHSPEILAQQPDGEMRDSCHCELSSHLTCVGTHIRNVSDRIVGEIKQL